MVHMQQHHLLAMGLSGRCLQLRYSLFISWTREGPLCGRPEHNHHCQTWLLSVPITTLHHCAKARDRPRVRPRHTKPFDTSLPQSLHFFHDQRPPRPSQGCPPPLLDIHDLDTYLQQHAKAMLLDAKSVRDQADPHKDCCELISASFLAV